MMGIASEKRRRLLQKKASQSPDKTSALDRAPTLNRPQQQPPQRCFVHQARERLEEPAAEQEARQVVNEVLNAPANPHGPRLGGTAGCNPPMCPARVRASNDRAVPRESQGVAGGPGFEPGLPGSEPGVLPLNYPPSTGVSPLRFHSLGARRLRGARSSNSSG